VRKLTISFPKSFHASLEKYKSILIKTSFTEKYRTKNINREYKQIDADYSDEHVLKEKIYLLIIRSEVRTIFLS
jgi:hypothetical protein